MKNWGCNSDSLSHHNKFVWEYYGRDKKNIWNLHTFHFFQGWKLEIYKEKKRIRKSKVRKFINSFYIFFTISFREETHREEIKGGHWLSRGGMKDVEAPDLCCFLTKGPYSTILYHHIHHHHHYHSLSSIGRRLGPVTST